MLGESPRILVKDGSMVSKKTGPLWSSILMGAVCLFWECYCFCRFEVGSGSVWYMCRSFGMSSLLWPSWFSSTHVFLTRRFAVGN